MSGATREERWVPVAESGERWAPRSKGEALRAMKRYPAGGRFADGGGWDGVVRIVRESRLVTEWIEDPE